MLFVKPILQVLMSRAQMKLSGIPASLEAREGNENAERILDVRD
jgi:hypothetical protein